MPSLNYERLKRFQNILEDAGLDCYLACTPISMGYLARFFESGGERMLLMAIRPKGDPAMLVPALSETHARHTGIEDIRTWKDGEDPGPIVEALAEDWNLGAGVIGVDDEMPAGYLLRLQEVLPAALFKCAGDEMALLRRRKDVGELALMRKAARIADRALGDVLPMELVDKSEREVAAKLTAGMTDRGGTPTFCIVAAGPNSAEPHHNTSANALKSGDLVVMDWG
nr:aminopeptidase P family protein [Armatimonadota bacterium]